MTIINTIQSLAVQILPAVMGLFGVYVGSKLASAREIKQRQLNFIEKQLASFYSPLLGIRTKIKSDSTLRRKLMETAEREWVLLMERASQKGPEEVKRVIDQEFPAYQKLINCPDKKFKEENFQLYKRMLDLFRENYWLADVETRRHYPELLEYVEVWQLNLIDALPFQVFEALDHSEGNLAGFYEDLTTKHDELREVLRRGAAHSGIYMLRN